MTEDVPFFLIVKQTACQKDKEPNKTCFNIDHHVHVILEKQVRHDDQSVVKSSHFMCSFVGNGLMNGPLPPAIKCFPAVACRMVLY